MDGTTLLRIAGVTPGMDGEGPKAAVLERLDYTLRRDIRTSPANVARILEMDSRWRGGIFYDEFRRRYHIRTPGEASSGLPLDDRGVRYVMRWLDDVYGVSWSKDKAMEGILMAGDTASQNPLQKYLTGLEWTDQTPRIDRFLTTHMGAPNTKLVHRISRCFFISAVKRAMCPGAKVDTVLILVGEQGLGKSRSIAALFGAEYFKDTPLDLSSADARRAISAGVWGYELGELDSFSKRDWSTIKAFLSADSDYVRMSYGRFHEDYKRQLVFVGTSNKIAILSDPTGSRRFWSIRVTSMDVEGITRDRDQLWAEAMVALNSGENWWLDSDAAGDLAKYNESYASSDPWESEIVTHLEGGPGLVFITTTTLLNQALGLSIDRVTRREGHRVAGIMTALGWEPGRGKEGPEPKSWQEDERPRVRGWTRPPDGDIPM